MRCNKCFFKGKSDMHICPYTDIKLNCCGQIIYRKYRKLHVCPKHNKIEELKHKISLLDERMKYLEKDITSNFDMFDGFAKSINRELQYLYDRIK